MQKKVLKMNQEDARRVEELVSSSVIIMGVLVIMKIAQCLKQFVLNVDRRLWCHLSLLVTDQYIAGIATGKKETAVSDNI
jgi:hypothetical protein